METGKKEARLLESEPSGGPGAGAASLDPDALKLALKNIKADFAEAKEPDPAQQTEKRRSLEELKRDFQAGLGTN